MKDNLKICFTIFFMVLILLACKDKSVEPEDTVEAEWEYLGLKGEKLNTLEIDPTNPDVIYVSGMTKLFKTTNGGVTWDSLATFYSGFFSMAIDPSNSKTIYKGRSNIEKSLDAGITWEKCSDSLDIDLTSFITILKINQKNPNTLYGGSKSNYGGAFFISLDSGKNWSIKAGGNSISAMAVDSQNYKRIFISFGPSLLKTTDMGENWISVGDRYSHIYNIVIDPKNSNKIFLGCGRNDGSVIKSEDAGESWEIFAEGIPENSNVEKMVVQKSNSNLYAFVINIEGWGIYRLRSEETTWQKIGIDSLEIADNPELYDLKVDDAGKYLYFCSTCGVYRLKLS